MNNLLIGVPIILLILVLFLWWIWYDNCDKDCKGKNFNDASFFVSQKVKGKGQGQKIKLFELPYNKILTKFVVTTNKQTHVKVYHKNDGETDYFKHMDLLIEPNITGYCTFMDHEEESALVLDRTFWIEIDNIDATILFEGFGIKTYSP